ncbi:MAG: hypothetical protein KI792_02965 [Alphaproteobacteria bacterium]|nr:hypothetical protein [Alphaproteobacteria bacterium SS10]
MPALTLRTFIVTIIAGSVATIFFDLFGQALSPMAGFAKLAPVPLATQTWGVVFGETYRPGGHLLHYIAGLIAYPVGWLFIWEPIVKRVAPFVPWLLSSIVYGVALWVFALYFMAHLVAGNPPFLNFTGITYVALVGHILFAVVAAAVYRYEFAIKR